MTSPGLPPVTAVIFDLDGVLVDSEPAHKAASRRLVAPQEMTDEEYERFIGASTETFMVWAQERYGITETIAELEQRYSDLVEDEVLALRLAPLDGVPELLEAIAARGVRLAVASQSLPHWVAGTLAGAELAHHFEVVVAADAVERGKPEPDIHLHTAGLLGVAPEACLVVEDSVPGVQAGFAAGMTVVQSRQATSRREPQPGASYVVDSLRAFDLGWLRRA